MSWGGLCNFCKEEGDEKNNSVVRKLFDAINNWLWG